ncbi:hypothetical protein [Legionella pneumophila]|uniref:Uncharacterized protein n=1 Tax=Legionella pneumophila subsp. pascullei TaxID=91890 RepID=A0AAX2IXK0_LEGPN|nr:hypothetical protein [Legionella pneumophila]AMP90204.1 hypothetical protein AXF35_11090 [Legionella pneumophila subsp. pascullei]AMP92129.1 hypothetical protein AXF36_05710 [Legionella pneumophila subsp. pascullei]AMP95094.1 hypothetical protein AXF37_05600 [Legionella pneumophila subsp. pascullei]SQG89973.1 Uncharacterised protein [Legionella pneumophila subsp. pascullei]VEH05781.1 Uncharacterised protein [Legionella pneumophila subsp. pascullei]
MKNILLSLIGSSFIIVSANGFATSKTDMEANWICTTNASTSEVASDIAADKQMSTTALPATKAFSFAAENCRDCTKITCEVKK